MLIRIALPILLNVVQKSDLVHLFVFLYGELVMEGKQFSLLSYVTGSYCVKKELLFATTKERETSNRKRHGRQGSCFKLFMLELVLIDRVCFDVSPVVRL